MFDWKYLRWRILDSCDVDKAREEDGDPAGQDEEVGDGVIHRAMHRTPAIKQISI